MRLNKLLISCSVILGLSASVWCAQTFKIEPAWSHVEFQVSNLGVNTVEGRFKEFAGNISYDETDVTRSSVRITIPIASIDTGIKKRDKHLQAPEFFEAAKYPEMTFQSERIEKQGNGYVMSGPLTIKGHTKEVRLPFTFSLEKSPEGTLTLRAEARGSINRHDFGIDYGSNFSVGKDVKILLHVQAVP